MIPVHSLQDSHEIPNGKWVIQVSAKWAAIEKVNARLQSLIPPSHRFHAGVVNGLLNAEKTDFRCQIWVHQRAP
jgi:hypothetical protein